MNTFTVDTGLFARTQLADAMTPDWSAHGASVIDAVRTWYSAAVGKAQIAKLTPRLLEDIYSEDAPHRAASHVRDGFGRQI